MSGITSQYEVIVRQSDGTIISSVNTNDKSVELPSVAAGTVTISVTPIGPTGARGPTTSITQNIGGEARALTPPTGLALDPGSGAGSAFSVKEPVFVWDPDLTDLYFDHYEVGVVGTSRSDTVTTASYTYDFAKNAADHSGTPSRSFTLQVRTVDTFGNTSAWTQLAVSNATPAALVPTLTVNAAVLTIDVTPPSDPDYVGMKVWLSTTSGFNPNTTTPIYIGTNDSIASKVDPDTTYYVRVAGYDTFGQTGLVISSEYSTTSSAATLPTRIDLASGGTLTAPAVEIADAGIFSATTGVFSITYDKVHQFDFSTVGMTFSHAGGSAITQMIGEVNAGFTATNYLGSGVAPVISTQHARGTIASPAAVAQNDALGDFSAYGYDGAAFRQGVRIRAQVVEATPGSTAFGSRLIVSIVPVGGASVVEAFRFDHEAGLQLFGANAVIDNNRLHVNRTATVATLHTGAVGKQEYATDLGGGGNLLIHNGTQWKRAGNGGQQSVSTNADYTLTVLTSAVNQRHTGTLTADRAATLSTTNATAGDEFTITRTGGNTGGPWNLNVKDAGGTTLKALVTNSWAKFVFDGTAWYLAAYGTL